MSRKTVLILFIAGILMTVSVAHSEDELLGLTKNPSFESDPVGQQGSPSGWTWEGPRERVQVMADSPVGEFGVRCLEFDFSGVVRSKSVWFLWSPMIPIDSKQTYVQSGWLRTQGLTSDGFGGCIIRRFFDKDKKLIPSANGVHYLVQHSGVTEWSWFRKIVVPDPTSGDPAVESEEIPANAAYVMVGASTHYYTKKVWYDGLRWEAYRPGIASPAAGQDRIARVETAAETITIDGKLDEAGWKGRWSGDFRQTVCPVGKAQKVKIKTLFKVIANEARVYFGIKCEQPAEVPLKKGIEKNGNIAVAQDDCIELFVDPTGLRQGDIHILVNPLGTHYIQFFNRPVSVDLKSAGRVTDTGWELEVSLSRELLWQLFHEAGMSCDSQLWNLNITRHQPGNPREMYTAWSYTGGSGFSNVKSLGYLLWQPPESVLRDKLNLISEKMSRVRDTNHNLLAEADVQLKEVADIQKNIENITREENVLKKSLLSVEATDASFARLMPEIAQLPDLMTAQYEVLSRLSVFLPESRKSYGYVIYQTPRLERPFAQRIPQKQELIDRVTVRLARNEITAGTFSIFCKELLKDVSILGSEFRKDNGKILPKEAIDIRILEPFGKRTESDILATDLRVKFEGWLSHYAERERFIPAIDANQSRKLWILVNAGSAEPGTYQGTVTVRPANKKATDVPVTIEVLPINLPESDRLLGFYYHGVINSTPGLSPGSPPFMFYNGLTTPKSCTAELTHIRSSGFNFVLLPAYARGPFDLEYCKSILTCAKKAGFDRVGLMGAEHIINRGVAETDQQKREIDANKKVFAQQMEKVLPMMKEMGFKEYYIYGCDEPHTPNDVERNRIIANEVHKFGGKVMTAFVFEDYLQTLKGIVDVPVLNWMGMTSGDSEVRGALTKGISLPFFRVGYYANLVARETPVSRLTFGWYLFKSRFAGNIPWAYYYMHLKWTPFNVDDYPHDSGFYVYPTLDEPIPTLKFEAAREGVNDLRYLEYLEMLLKKCSDKTKADACREKLNSMLSEISLTNERGVQSANFLLPPHRLDEFKRALQEMVLSLPPCNTRSLKP